MEMLVRLELCDVNDDVLDGCREIEVEAVELIEDARLVKILFMVTSLAAVMTNVPEFCVHPAEAPNSNGGTEVIGSCTVSLVCAPTKLVIVIVDKFGKLQFVCRVSVMVVMSETIGKFWPIFLTVNTGKVMKRGEAPF